MQIIPFKGYYYPEKSGNYNFVMLIFPNHQTWSTIAQVEILRQLIYPTLINSRIYEIYSRLLQSSDHVYINM